MRTNPPGRSEVFGNDLLDSPDGDRSAYAVQRDDLRNGAMLLRRGRSLRACTDACRAGC